MTNTGEGVKLTLAAAEMRLLGHIADSGGIHSGPLRLLNRLVERGWIEPTYLVGERFHYEITEAGRSAISSRTKGG